MKRPPTIPGQPAFEFASDGPAPSDSFRFETVGSGSAPQVSCDLFGSPAGRHGSVAPATRRRRRSARVVVPVVAAADPVFVEVGDTVDLRMVSDGGLLRVRVVEGPTDASLGCWHRGDPLAKAVLVCEAGETVLLPLRSGAADAVVVAISKRV